MTVDTRLMGCLVAGFIAATVVGTLTHEFGHFVAARLLGFDARISYDRTFWSVTTANQTISPVERFIIALGGPLVTCLTGSIGMFIIWTKRKSFEKSRQLFLGQWVLILVSLFWIRQTVNFLITTYGYFLNGRYSETVDEVRLATYLEVPWWVITLSTASVGLSVLGVLLFRFIPGRQRQTFLAAGLLGGLAGYILWFYLVGPSLLP